MEAILAGVMVGAIGIGVTMEVAMDGLARLLRLPIVGGILSISLTDFVCCDPGKLPKTVGGVLT